MNSLSTFAAPLLALLGTLVVAGLGFYQWRRQAAHQSRGAVAEARRKAAESLWAKLEEVNLAVRESGPANVARLQALEREVNALFLQNSLYLEDATQKVVSGYVRALLRACALLAETGGEAAQEWANTSIEAAAADPEVAQALADVERRRAEVKGLLLRSTGA